jgi:hypothetical protein
MQIVTAFMQGRSVPAMNVTRLAITVGRTCRPTTSPTGIRPAGRRRRARHRKAET